jgi:short-subunit dehydrogenase
MSNQSKYTLITGSSQGMGEQMAHECGKLGRNVLLVSLSGEKLESVAKELATKYNIKTDFFECDLTAPNGVESVFNWTQEKGYAVNFLVNNAGFGGVGSFDEYSFKYINGMLDLNIKATTNMCHYFIPELKKNAPSHILNNASMVANFPCPYKSIYAASKVYVKSFSRALREELKPFNVSVSVLQPGATPTNKVVKDQINKGGFLFKVSVLDVKQVAKIAITKTLSGKPVIVPGFKNRVSLALVKAIPAPILLKIIASKAKSV